MKKKSAKKCISFFMVLLLCASFLPTCVFAAEIGQDTEQTDIQIMTQEEEQLPDEKTVPAVQEEQLVDNTVTTNVQSSTQLSSQETSPMPVLKKSAWYNPFDTEYTYAWEDKGFFKYATVWTNIKHGTYLPVISEEYQNQQITWTSSDESVAYVDENGAVHLKQPKGAKITATLPNQVYGTFMLHIYQIVVKNPSIEMNVDDTDQVLAYVEAEEPRNVSLILTYKLNESSAKDVVTVDENGKLYAIGAGEAKIDVGVQGTEKTETVNVKVSDPEAAPPAGGDSEGETDDQSGGGSEGGTGDQPGDGSEGGTDDQSGGGSEGGTDDQSGSGSEDGTDSQPGDESESGTVVPGSDSSGGDASGTGSDGQNTITGDQTDTGATPVTESKVSEKPDKKPVAVTDATAANSENTKAASKATVTKKTVTKKTVTRRIASPGVETASGETSQSTRSVASQNSSEVTPEGETAAVPADVINDPSVPTAAYVNPAGGGGILPSTDNMAAHAGAVAGMLAAAAGFGAVGMVRAYQVKKYEADV